MEKNKKEVFVFGPMARDMALRASAETNSEQAAITAEARKLAVSLRPLWAIAVRKLFVEQGVVASQEQVAQGVAYMEESYLDSFGAAGAGLVAGGSCLLEFHNCDKHDCKTHGNWAHGGAGGSGGAGYGLKIGKLAGKLKSAAGSVAEGWDKTKDLASAAGEAVGNAKDAVDDAILKYKDEHALENAQEKELAGVRADIASELKLRVAEEQAAIDAEIDRVGGPEGVARMLHDGGVEGYLVLKARQEAVSNGKVAKVEDVDRYIEKQTDKAQRAIAIQSRLDTMQEGSQEYIDFVSTHGPQILEAADLIAGFIPGGSPALKGIELGIKYGSRVVRAAQSAQLVSGIVDQIQEGDKIGAAKTAGSVIGQIVLGKAMEAAEAQSAPPPKKAAAPRKAAAKR